MILVTYDLFFDMTSPCCIPSSASQPDAFRAVSYASSAAPGSSNSFGVKSVAAASKVGAQICPITRCRGNRRHLELKGALKAVLPENRAIVALIESTAAAVAESENRDIP